MGNIQKKVGNMGDHLLLSVFLAVVLLDGITTRIGMAMNFYELNPFARYNMGIAYIMELIIAALLIGFYGLAESSRYSSPSFYFIIRRVIFIGTFILLGVTTWNIIQIIGAW